MPFCTAALLFAPALLASALHAQAPAGPAAEVQHSYSVLKGNILKAAEKMPAADYQFKGTPEIRTYARVVNHITEAQFHTCDVLNGHAFDPKQVPAETADKSTVVKALESSFSECDKAYGSLTDSNLTEMVTFGQNRRSRIGAAWGNVSHDNEQYATLSIYLRLKGLVPPTAEK